MRKSLLLALAFVFSCMLHAQDNIYIIDQGFDGETLPSGWTTMGNGLNNWYISMSNISGGKPNEAHLKWTPPFNGISRLVSPAVDLSNVTSAILTLKHYPSFFGSNHAIVGVATSSDNGDTWNSVWSEEYNANGQYTILETIESPDMGKNNVLFCIYFEGSSSAISDWYFDDFQVYTVEDLSIELSSIDIPSIVSHGKHDISFTIKNTGSSAIQTFKARYTIGETSVEQNFFGNIISMESMQFTFNNDFVFNPDESYTTQIEILSVNDNNDDDSDNSLSKDVVSAMSHTQMTPMIEHFSSSTCNPCIVVNQSMETLTANHEGEFTYTKYTTNGPGLGDPYFTSEGGTRMTYYNVMGVPQTYLNGADQGNAAVTEENFVDCYDSPAFAKVRGSFTTEANIINVTADFMSYFDMENVRAFVTVNEKTTTGNASSNGETEFHHVMMKMFENAEGNIMNINAGEYQRLEFSYDMSSTNVEEMSDLEVALWLQNYETKEIYNSHFAYENTEHCHPVNNMTANFIGDDMSLQISWEKPENVTPTGYNIYVDGELVSENINETIYQSETIDSDSKVAEVVAVYQDGMTSVGVAKIIGRDTNVEETISENISVYPNPADDFVKVSTVNSQRSTVRVYNYLGILVEEIEIDSSEMEINVAEYDPGIYFFNVETEKGNVVKKIVKI